MAVPKRRHSKSRKRIKKAYFKIAPLNLRACPKCGTKTRPHYACVECGTYKNRQIVKIKEKKATPKDA
ncbi:50S ribosomal protein L32 [Candidatus Marinamargulisbacteria bacterium SCGC AAA071-K20]|nr:50S ribosomal protein L32 [Candidatus Marinamargulisbacteria bacterium SCGC AAA071-K20]